MFARLLPLMLGLTFGCLPAARPPPKAAPPPEASADPWPWNVAQLSTGGVPRETRLSVLDPPARLKLRDAVMLVFTGDNVYVAFSNQDSSVPMLSVWKK